MDEKIFEKKLTIGVGKEKAELLKSILKELDLLDKYHRSLREENTIFLPLSRKPKDEEIKKITEKLGEAILEEKEVIAKEKLLEKNKLIEEIKSAMNFYKIPFRYLAYNDVVILESKFDDFLEKYIELIRLERKNVKSIYKIRNLSLLYKGVIPELVFGENKEIITYEDEDLKLYSKINKNFIDVRLRFERNKLTNEIKKGERIIELCAGAGLLSIDIAKKREIPMIAAENDFELYELLLRNIEENQVKNLVKPIFFEKASKLEEFFLDRMDRVIIWEQRRSGEMLDTAYKITKKSGGVITAMMISKEDETYEDILSNLKFNNAKVEVRKLLRLTALENLVRVDIKLL